MKNKKRILEVLDLVAQDAENDANNLDGQPFTGKTVATQMGNMLASIKTLAEIIKEVIEEEKI